MNLLASLRYLAALDEHKHFGRAAQACNITQPALSNALRALETEFGTVIVKRGRSFEGFTTEGLTVLASAHRMLHEREMLQQELSSVINQPKGSLNIGAVPTAMPIAARFAAMLNERYPGIAPVVRSMSSTELEAGLENLSLDMGLGYTDRLRANGSRLKQVPQYTEHYFFVRKAEKALGTAKDRMRMGPKISWSEIAKTPLCLLTPEMHNRSIVDQTFETLGFVVKPAIQTNSILALALSVAAGNVCTVMSGALLDPILGYGELEALPLIGPEIRSAIGFIVPSGDRPFRTLEVALEMAEDAVWLRHAAAHSGLINV